EDERARGRKEVEAIGQRIRACRRDDGCFTLDERRGLPFLKTIRAGPMELPHRESKCLRIRSSALAKPRLRTQLVAGLAALEQRRHVRRRLQIRQTGEVANLT